MKHYKTDGYDWKTRNPSTKTIREDRTKLKVCGHTVSLSFSLFLTHSLTLFIQFSSYYMVAIHTVNPILTYIDVVIG